MGCGKRGKARQGPSCRPLLSKKVEAVPAKAFLPLNALRVCSRWWCQRSRGMGGAGQVFNTAQRPEEVRAAAQRCEHLQTAVTLDAASQLWSHLTAWDWASSSIDVCDHQESVCNPSIFLPPSSLPACPGWQLNVFLLRLSLGNSQLMLTGAKQTVFKSTSWNKLEDCLGSWDF